MSEPDLVNHPPHYTVHSSGVECIDVVEGFDFNLANAIKYVWRAGLKGSRQQDLQKALWYLDRAEKNRALGSDVVQENVTNAIAKIADADLGRPDLVQDIVLAAEIDDLERIRELLSMEIAGVKCR